MTLPTQHVPLFPLNSVILPQGRIPLQLFEPRYIDMLTRCLKEERGFVVVLLREGGEASLQASFYDIGTYVRIVDFRQLENGLLGITVEGDRKVVVEHSWQAPDGLHLGNLTPLDDEPEVAVPDEFGELPLVLKALCRHPVVRELEMAVDYSDARMVGWRLTELLPIHKDEKQRLLELHDPVERLAQLAELVDELD